MFAIELAELIKKYNATARAYIAKEYDDDIVVEFTHRDESGNLVVTTLLDSEIEEIRKVKVIPHTAKG
jgi:hypothetical protein